MCNEKDTNCIAEILGVILVLQQNVCGDSCLDSCDRPMLGGGPTCLACNTRPVMIYTCGGGNVPWSMPTTKDSTAVCDGNSGVCSSVFRVEKIEGNQTVKEKAPCSLEDEMLVDKYIDSLEGIGEEEKAKQYIK